MHSSAGLHGVPVGGRAVDVLDVEVVEPLLALANGLGRIHLRPRRVAHVDAEADAAVVALHGLPHVVGRGEALVLGAVVVDGQADVELLHHGVEDGHGVGVGAAHDGGKPEVARVLEGAADARGVVLHGDVAAAQGVMPASLKRAATALRSSVVLVRARWKSLMET